MSVGAAPLIADLRARARALGFDAFGIAPANARPDLPHALTAWLDAGYAADMDWMGDTATRRGNPQTLWPRARSIIMLGRNYGPDGDPLANLDKPHLGTISVYARHRDYHELIKGHLKELAGLLARRAGAEVKVFVDTAPIMEKPLAEAAGLGFQGKHTVLVSRTFGNWLFLGAILTDAELPYDAPEPNRCGTCTRCLDICPTKAFPAPFRLDASRCLAYFSVEHKGPIPAEFRVPMGNRIYGCDDCLAVCPWNSFASATRDARLAARADLVAPELADLAGLDDTAFRRLFAGSPIKRIGRARFVRNVLIAIGNATPSLLPHVLPRLADPEPLVRGAAIWALRRLGDTETVQSWQSRLEPDEPHAMVKAEWRLPMPPGAQGRG